MKNLIGRLFKNQHFKCFSYQTDVLISQIQVVGKLQFVLEAELLKTKDPKPTGQDFLRNLSYFSFIKHSLQAKPLLYPADIKTPSGAGYPADIQRQDTNPCFFKPLDW